VNIVLESVRIGDIGKYFVRLDVDCFRFIIKFFESLFEIVVSCVQIIGHVMVFSVLFRISF